MKNMKYFGTPVVGVTVVLRNFDGLPQILSRRRKLGNAASVLLATPEESGRHALAGNSEFHNEIRLNKLQNEYTSCPINISNPFIECKERVTASSNQVCLSRRLIYTTD